MRENKELNSEREKYGEVASSCCDFTYGPPPKSIKGMSVGTEKESKFNHQNFTRLPSAFLFCLLTWKPPTQFGP